MKKINFVIRSQSGEYQVVTGYEVMDVLAVWKFKGMWAITHLPSGYGMTGGYDLRREAVEAALRLREFNSFDWYAIEGSDVTPSAIEYSKVLEVADGKLKAEDYELKLLQERFTRC